jgi:hypothetical protein
LISPPPHFNLLLKETSVSLASFDSHLQHPQIWHYSFHPLIMISLHEWSFSPAAL